VIVDYMPIGITLFVVLALAQTGIQLRLALIARQEHRESRQSISDLLFTWAVGTTSLSQTINGIQPVRRLSGFLIVQESGKYRFQYQLPPAGQLVIAEDLGTVKIQSSKSLRLAGPVSIRAARTCYYLEIGDRKSDVFVNGQLTSKCSRLDDGDEIQIDHIKLIISYQYSFVGDES